MTDIVERLRNLKSIWSPDDLRKEAADEIERLRKGMEEYTCTGTLLSLHAQIAHNSHTEIERLRAEIERDELLIRARDQTIAVLKAEIERLREILGLRT